MRKCLYCNSNLNSRQSATCGRACRRKLTEQKHSAKCEVCKSDFLRRQPKSVVCSVQCANELQRIRQRPKDVACKCGKVFTPIGGKKFCSRKCAFKNGKNGKRRIRICVVCREYGYWRLGRKTCGHKDCIKALVPVKLVPAKLVKCNSEANQLVVRWLSLIHI